MIVIKVSRRIFPMWCALCSVPFSFKSYVNKFDDDTCTAQLTFLSIFSLASEPGCPIISS